MVPFFNIVWSLPTLYNNSDSEDSEKLGLDNKVELEDLPICYRTYINIDNFGPIILKEGGEIDPDFMHLVSGGETYTIKVGYEDFKKIYEEKLREHHQNPISYVVTFSNN